jgi:septum formation protein
MKPLVLASTSRFRRALLDRLGLEYEARCPSFEEIAPEGMAPADVARVFAEGKARSADCARSQWAIGADQVLDLEGRILRKTENLEECKAQLAELAGRTHALHTAVALFSPAAGATFSETVTVELTMRSLDAATIARYVELDRPVGSVGGYFYESRGVCLFEAVRGGDESAIVGLPLVALCRLLCAAGLEPLRLIG